MRKTTLALGLGLALSLAGADVIGAQSPRGEGRRPGAEGRGPRQGGRMGGPQGLLLKDITLTDAQKAQLQQLREKDRTERVAARKAQGEQGRQGARRARGDTLTQAQREKVRAEMQAAHQRQVAGIRGILTAEQRVQFDRNVAELEARRAEMEQRRAQDGRDGKGGRGPGFRGAR